MRRRKERTLLTCMTLVLLTFTVLSFTSIVNTIRYNDVGAPGVSAYNGILLRMPTWDPLQQPAYRLLNDEYGGRFAVAPRAWFFGTAAGQQSFLHLTRAHFGTDVKGVAGFTPQEAQVTGVDKALAVRALVQQRRHVCGDYPEIRRRQPANPAARCRQSHGQLQRRSVLGHWHRGPGQVQGHQRSGQRDR